MEFLQPWWNRFSWSEEMCVKLLTISPDQISYITVCRHTTLMIVLSLEESSFLDVEKPIDSRTLQLEI